MNKKIILQKKTITDNNIPVIECYAEGTENAPMVLLNHGTTGNAMTMLDMAVRLAERGCFCVSIDALWHGGRSDDKLNIMLTTSLYKEYYLNMLLEMAADMTRIIDFYSDNPMADTMRVGMTGISQGGYVAYMTMTKDSRIKAAAPLIGSPDLTDKYGNSLEWEDTDPSIKQRVIDNMPLSNYKKMAKTALLIQNCNDDTVVPVTGTRRLNEKLAPLYKESGINYRYMEYTGGHNCNPRMIQNAIDWLCDNL